MRRQRHSFLHHRHRAILVAALKAAAEPEKVWTTPDFPAQNAFIMSKAPKVLAQCTRRGGKSFGFGTKLVKTAWENPGRDSVYIALTRDSAENILYKDILVEIFNRHGIRFKANLAKLRYTLSNGHTIHLAGADQSDKEMYKLLGKKFSLVGIDEAAFFKQDLQHLIEEVLEPTLIDLGGQLYMLSTPGPNVYSYYYEASTGKAPGWDIHKWTAFDNPMIADNWKQAIERKIAENPAIVKTPSFRRMYKNEWVVDDNLQVYKTQDMKILSELPDIGVRGAEWSFGLGIDLGWEDDNAFSVVAWHDYSNVLYLVARMKKKAMTFDEVKDYTEKLDQFYGGFKFVVVDGANKQGVETMRAKSRMVFTAAEKTAKRENIEVFNSEAIQQRVVLIAPDGQGDFSQGHEQADPLLNEWQGLIWDEKLLMKGKHQEDPRCPNHLADATLYAWRHAYNYTSLPVPEDPPAFDSEEAMDAELEMMKERLTEGDIDGGYGTIYD